MVAFSKPAQATSSSEGANVLSKRKRTVNSKITDVNNVDKEAVKRRKLLNAEKSAQNKEVRKQPTAGPSNHQASVEVEEEAPIRHNGPPKNPNSVIVAADGSNNIDPDDTPPELIYIPNKEEEYDKDELEAEPKQETAEEELGNFEIPDFSYAHQFFNYRAPAKKLAIPYLCLLPC